MSTRHATSGMAYSGWFRRLAEDAAGRAAADREDPNLGKHPGCDGSPLTYSLHAWEAVTLAVAALEAGINEIAAWLKLGFLGAPLAIPDEFIRRKRLTEKWAEVPRLVCRVEFDRGSSPWQDFSTLVKLRDQLVHFKWYYQSPPKFMRYLQAKDLALPDNKPGMYWVDAALTDRVAAWAVTTVDNMFVELTRLLGRQADENWTWR